MSGAPRVLVLCGGAGTRLRQETEYKPKALVEIGGRPILWHIMKLYTHAGFRDFVLALGYKGFMIKEYFLNFERMNLDFTLNLRTKAEHFWCHAEEREDWTITFSDTGLGTPTGGRVHRARKYLNDATFFVTYGDGVADVDLRRLLDFHRRSGKLATLTGVHPSSPFGVIESAGGVVTSFKEKPYLEGLINGGFFVFEPGVFDYLGHDTVLEEDPLRRLAAEGQLAVYEHRGFWSCMDTFKDVERLNAMWERGERPWRLWSRGG